MNIVINEKTKVPLGVIAAFIIVLIPLVVWAVRVESNSRKGAQAHNLYYKIDKRLDRIEIKLGTKPENDLLETNDDKNF